MTYGGKELGASQETLGQWCASMAQFADSAAGSAGARGRASASFGRVGNSSWKTATEELNQMTKQVLGAQIRLEIAQKDLDIHATQIDQAQEIHDFLKSRFSNVELYTFLSSQLMRLYPRERPTRWPPRSLARPSAATSSSATAPMCSFKATTGSPSGSGLLAGERLLLQLKSHGESVPGDQHPRSSRSNQSFSLLQLDPGALQALQLTGKCTFTLAETWFDLQ